MEGASIFSFRHFRHFRCELVLSRLRHFTCVGQLPARRSCPANSSVLGVLQGPATCNYR